MFVINFFVVVNCSLYSSCRVIVDEGWKDLIIKESSGGGGKEVTTGGNNSTGARGGVLICLKSN